MINTSYRLAPWANVLYACDASWWLHYFPQVAKGFQGEEMWTISRPTADRLKIDYVQGLSGKGLARGAAHIITGRNSGYQAIGLAHLWGARRILLLGYDFQRTAGRAHWHTDHPAKLGNGGRFADWVREMNDLAADLKAAGVEVVNCSRATAITAFARAPIEACLP